MARSDDLGKRKRRTREHVIADLAVNHIERHVLRCGYTMERIRYDYGLDIEIYTYSRGGEIENGLIWSQIKATERPRKRADGSTIAVRVERRDLLSWVGQLYPVILILYDAKADKAYWLHVQSQCEEGRVFLLAHRSSTITLHVARSQVVNEAAVREFRRLKQAAEVAAKK